MTGKDPIPFEITNGFIQNHTDLKTNQKEADTILTHHVATVGPEQAVVISYDRCAPAPLAFHFHW